MEYVCPKEIEALFETEELAQNVGRQAALDWIISLDLQIGDRAWLPEGGWVIKEGLMKQ